MSEENYYYLDASNESQGPVTETKIREMVTAGVLTPSSRVARVGEQEWHQLSDVLSMPVPEGDRGAKTSDSKNQTLMDKLATSGKITAVQAKLEKLKKLSLVSALRSLGERAFELSLNEIVELKDEITKLEEEIEGLKVEDSIPADASLVDKSKHQAHKAQKRINIESLKGKRKALLIEIGEVVTGLVDPPIELHDVLQQVHKVKAQISELEAETEELRSKVSGIFARPVVVLSAVAGLVILAASWSSVSSWYQSYKAQSESERRMAESEALEAQSRAELRQLELESREEQLQMKKEAQVERRAYERQIKEEELKLQKLELKAELERDIAVERDGQERAARALVESNRLAQEELQAKMDTQEAERLAEVEARQAQENRRAVATAELSKVSLSESVYLSNRLKQSGSKTEVKGKDLRALRAAQVEGDWLRMLSIAKGHTYEELPRVDTIKEVAKKLSRYTRFQLLLNSRLDLEGSLSLYYVTFPQDNIFRSTPSGWKEHPDGVGYYHDWRPSDGEVVILVGTYKDVGKKLSHLQRQYSDERSALREKLKLGELTEAQVAAQYVTWRAHAARAVKRLAAQY